MKTTLFTLLMLCVCSELRADAPTVVSEASPLVEVNGVVEILMADGSARRVRKLLSMSPDVLRVMTDDGIGKISLATLHPQSLVKLNSMMESPEQTQARQQREAASAQSYRENQALRERLANEENAMIAGNQRAEAARQEAARQAAAEARERWMAQMLESQKIQAAQRAETERRRAEAEERWRQYKLDVATLQALQDLTLVAQLEYLRKLGYVIR